MLRHACGFALANKGHDTRALHAYLGHKNIQHTVRYTELARRRSGIAPRERNSICRVTDVDQRIIGLLDSIRELTR